MMKVSVIVPIYNVGRYINECVKSLIEQTYKNIEIILVDDGSTDGCEKICDEFAQRESRIKAIHQKNCGLSAARNTGISAANGDYILFVDGDDCLVKNAIEILIEYAKMTEVDVVQFRYNETTEPKCEKYQKLNEKPIIINNCQEMFGMLYKLGGIGASACTKLYKREIFNTLMFKVGILHEDEHFSTYLFQKIKDVAYINDELYLYRIRESSIITGNFSSRRLDVFNVMEDRIEQLVKLGFDEYAEREKIRYFNSLVYYWSESKFAKNNDCCNVITYKMKEFCSKYKIYNNMFNKIMYNLCRINPRNVAIFHIMRRIKKCIKGS